MVEPSLRSPTMMNGADAVDPLLRTDAVRFFAKQGGPPAGAVEVDGVDGGAEVVPGGASPDGLTERFVEARTTATTAAIAATTTAAAIGANQRTPRPRRAGWSA